MILTKKEIIKDLAARSKVPVIIMKKIYLCLEQYIMDIMSYASLGEDVELKLFNGITLYCKYNDKADEKLSAFAKITSNFNHKINETHEENNTCGSIEASDNSKEFKTVECISCGKLFDVSKYSKSCRCEKCRHEYKNECDRNRMRSSRNENVAYA